MQTPDASTILLSTTGSDRATAYLTSNKIVRHEGRLYVGWLDSPAQRGQLSPIRLAICDGATGAVEQTLTLGKAYDNHCGPAIAVDRNGRFHAIIGAHHNPFLYRWSDTPSDAASWSEPVALGPYDTYPSLVVDAQGTLHLVHRKMEDRWQLWYRRKPVDGFWEPWVILAAGPLPGYNHFYQSLSVGPGGALHLLFLYCYTDTGKSSDAKGRMVVHLTSEDGGDSWFNEGKRCRLPLGVDSVKPICHYPQGGLKISNHVVDDQNRLHFFAMVPETVSGVLLRRETSGWEQCSLPPAFEKLNLRGGRESGLTRDASGTLHFVTGTNPDGEEARWYDPRHEIFHATLPAQGDGSVRQLTQTGPTAANWLPALENWDWCRAAQAGENTPALAFCSGVTGGQGTNINTLKTEVHLVPALAPL